MRRVATLSRARLDDLLVERGLAGTRDRAQALVAAGLVEVEGSHTDLDIDHVLGGQAGD